MKVKYDNNGLVPMIIKDAESGAVLALFYGNKESIEKTERTGYVWRYSRSKRRLMKKGQTSGNYMKMISISSDCDNDALLVKVKPLGPACHLNRYSCFKDEKDILYELAEVIKGRKEKPRKDSYTASIVRNRSAIIEKLEEELEELIEARGKGNIKWESADLLYFMLVYLENRNVQLADVLAELGQRRKSSKR